MATVARLIEQIRPIHYQIDKIIDFEGFGFTATEVAQFELVDASHQLVWHAVGANLTIISAVLEDGASGTIKFSEADQTVTFGFKSEISAGEHTLTLEFSGKIPESLHGFYRSNYVDNGVKKRLLTTQFEAVHAREAIVCIDEPAAKAVFELSLTVPKALTALSNMNVVSEIDAENSLKKVQFAPTPKMSAYLLAYIVGELEYVEGATKRGTIVRVYATPGKKSQLSFALDTSVRGLEFYEGYFGVDFPLPKYDQIAIPDFASGAMENWGLVTFRETAAMLDREKTSLAQMQRVAEVVTHELSHMWFGDLVTMEWWNDIWLNEGFATWVASLGMDALFPDWKAWTQFVADEQGAALNKNSLASAPSLQIDIDDPRELDSVFDPSVIYAKGASVIRMLDAYLGRETFQKGLQLYLSRHAYGNAVTNDLWAALGEASGKPVADVMSVWISRPGYPVLSYANGDVNQKRFYASPEEAAKVNDATAWPVPFGAILAGGSTAQQQLLEETTVELAGEIVTANWFKPNPGQTGLYRSLYTEAMIEALAAPLTDGTLETTDRLGVVSDVVATTEAGLTSSKVLLRLVASLREETDQVVWSDVSGGLGSILGVVEDEALRARLEKFGLWLVGPNLARLGWEAKDGETAFDTLMRPIVLQQAIRYGDEATKQEAKRRFAKYLEDGTIDPDLRVAIYYAVAWDGGEAEFDTILDLYRREQVPQVKQALQGTLGRFRKPELIQRSLDLGISDEVRPQDTIWTIAYGFMNRDARELAWEFTKNNWQLFLKRYGAGGHMLDNFPHYAGMSFSSRKLAAELGAFFSAPENTHPATVRPTAQAVEAINLRAAWYERDKAAIEALLTEWESKRR